MKHLAVRLSLFLCLLYAAPLFAQTADVSGTVIDQLGAVVPGAKVRLVNQGTLIERKFTTNSEGVFSAPFVNPGLYQVFVEAQGFSTEAIRDIKVEVGAHVNIPIHLTLGRQDATVTVDGSGLTINTTDAAVSTVIDQKFVENIPLNGRSFQDLISLTPGVVTQSPQASVSLGVNGDFSINGQRTESNYYMVDGVSANTSAGYAFGSPSAANGGTVPGATALGTTQSLLSVDALQEFRVESSTYSAEYGRSPGGQLSFVTRSGTNTYHGSAFDYLRNNAFDANDWFNDYYGRPATALRQNDFGGTIGGRVLLPKLYDGKDKAFFFVSYEGLRLTQPQGATVQYVPDLALRQNATPTLQPIMNAFPLPSAGGEDYDNGFAQFIEPYSLPGQINSTIVRLDYKLAPKISLFFRVGDTPSYTSSRHLSVLNKIGSNSQNYTLGATAQFTSAVANEFRLGYSRGDSAETSAQDNFGGAQPVSLQDSIGLGGYNNSSSNIFFILAGLGTTSFNIVSGESQTRQWNIVDSVSMEFGKHHVKAGIDSLHIKSPLRQESPYVLAEYIGDSGVLTNSADALLIEKYADATPLFNELAAFVQDQWSVSQPLSLSFGLRWEVDPPPTEQHGDDAYTILGNINNPATLSLAPHGTPLWKTYWSNFAPRIGLAWTANPASGRETVVRAGGGVFFDTANELATLGYEGAGFFSLTESFGAPLPVAPTQLSFSTAPVAPYSTVYAFPSHLQLPYSLEWNASLEQALGKAQALTISYVGSNGRRLIQEQELVAPSPNFSGIVYVPGGTTSNYQALQVQYQKTVSRGIHALASYTWSHSLDYGSNANALPLTRGNSDFDVRQNFQGGASWDLPLHSSSAWENKIFAGWGLDGRLIARTSFPITLQGNEIIDPVTGNLYLGNVDLVSGQPLYLYGNQYPGGKAVNPEALALPANGGVGDAPRNFVRGFGETQINLAARREFKLNESMHLQFRSESFNLLNHPNFGYVDPLLGDATFGMATMMLNQSLGTVASQYQQGGPRSMQFALRLQF
jgi:Carboxypeptidase regulatory-like domain/TonB dependent receptor/TonB-dependent Receptor Plug Domain